ncbi:TIGR04255 family protein [Methanoplanus endosymbiosus]|uniref:TIGR04255 family protein n=1 Tax=Methanoplanus endosymbiosus TaxID=33865 RepID=A0A9E7TM48_9EURY|nr:TIGR04255 family protein [Methanoplanus endosymbiosus]UUX92971.1 TIGR04255 family protein [Methanoplanus endosymbiosus]
MTDYSNSPIREAVCEFRFSKKTGWDKDLSLKFYEKIKSEFPKKEVNKVHHFQVEATIKGIQNSKNELNDRHLFFDNDRRYIIQITQGVLSISCLKPYPSWEVFKEKIRLAYNTLGELTDINGIERIGLLYVNKIEISDKPVELKEYFTFYPNMPEKLNLTVGNINMASDFLYNHGKDICRVQLTRAVPEKKEDIAFLLTTDFFTAKPGSVKPDDALLWTEVAHTEIKNIFRNCITEKTESLFKGAE